VVELLIRQGADIEYKTKHEGKTALIHASYNGASACVNVIIDKYFDK
jgi:ankyrin repeat protein